MEQESRLSLPRVIWTDYPAFYASLVPLVSWIVYLAWAPDWRGQGPVIKPEVRPIFFALVIIASAAGLLVAGYRLWLFARVFHSGAKVRGKINHFELKRDHGRLECAYIFDHHEYLSSTAVHRNAQTKALKSGEHVILVVDRSKPSRAFIHDLYTRR